MRNKHHFASQKHGSDRLESVRASQIQYGAGLITVGSLALGKVKPVSDDSMFEQHEKERVLERKVLLAILDICHRRPCISKLAISGQRDEK